MNKKAGDKLKIKLDLYETHDYINNPISIEDAEKGIIDELSDRWC